MFFVSVCIDELLHALYMYITLSPSPVSIYTAAVPISSSGDNSQPQGELGKSHASHVHIECALVSNPDPLSLCANKKGTGSQEG